MLKKVVKKASAADFDGRFREIISDPLNLLIPRHAEAGLVQDGCVILHNGHRVAVEGEYSYYDQFSKILIYNRGVHEPLEEYAFQSVLPHLPERPVMIELGAYWGHYSMWLKQQRADADVTLVEPDGTCLEAGRRNFERNGYVGRFVADFVGKGHFEIDTWMAETDLEHLTILHSDIQGYELEMLDGAARTLAAQKVDYAFVSTHSQALHEQVVARLSDHGYRIEAAADFDTETTCFDGFVLAVRPQLPRVLAEKAFLSRQGILEATSKDTLRYLADRLEADRRTV